MKKISLIAIICLSTLFSFSLNQISISNVRKISQTQGGFTGQLHSGDQFGIVEAIGDVDGDGIEDIAVGVPWDDDGGTNWGAIWIFFMNSNGGIKKQQKISAIAGNFNNTLSDESYFGRSITSLGDFNNDNIPDIAVGAWGADDGDVNSGAVWIILLNNNGTVLTSQKISAIQGGLVGLTANRQFGFGVTSLGDLDGDGITDIAVGSPTYDNDGGLYRGCVWILFLNQNGTVKSQQKINDYQGGFTGILEDEDRFGLSLENMGDINKDGTIDIAVQAYNDDDGGDNTGAIYILFLNKNGTVKQTQKISALQGNFTGKINSFDLFGIGISNLGDIDGDGTNDMLTSSYLSDDCGIDRGKVWILYMNPDGTVKDYSQINCSDPSLTGRIDNADYFGISVSNFSGYTEEGKKQLLIGTIGDDDSYSNAGAVYILDIDAVIPEPEIISNVRKISQTQGGFTGQLHEGDFFGISATSIGDIDGDGIDDLAVGAQLDDDGGTDFGAIWILFMNQNRTVKRQQKISALSGNFNGSLTAGDHFGESICPLGDFNGDGIPDIIVGSPYADDGGINSGVLWILFLGKDGKVLSTKKISSTNGGLTGLTPNNSFGNSVCSLGDLDGDSICDIAVGAPTYDDDGGSYRGSVWILFLNRDGSVKSKTILNDFKGNLNITLDDNDRFGSFVQNIGDINKDGIIDIATAATFDDDGEIDAGACYIIFLNPDGTANHTQKISGISGGFDGEISTGDLFGRLITPLGDINGDGINDIAVSSSNADIGGENRGNVWIFYLNINGTVKDYQAINSSSSLLSGLLEDNDVFGCSLAAFPNYSSEGKKEIVIGARGDDDGYSNAGAVYILDIGNTPSLILSKSAVNFVTAGSSDTITVTSNIHWTATSNQPWLSVSPSSATGDSKLIITATQNTYPSTRNATITLIGQGIEAKTITVSQESDTSTNFYFTIDPSTISILGSNGSKGTFNVSSNTTWSVSTNQTWMKLSPKSGTGNKTVTVTSVGANPSTLPRNGSVMVSAEGFASLKVAVIQAAGDTTLSVTNNIVNIGYAEGSSAWTGITSNTSWNASSDQSWLTVTPQNGDGNRNLVFVAKENPLSTSRSANVTVAATGAKTQIISVIQAAKSGISFATDTVYIGCNEGSTAQLPVSANVSWRAVQDQTWLLVDPGSGVGDTVITFTASANPTAAQRTSVVSISGINIGVTHVTVIQEAALPMLSIEDTGFIIANEGGAITDVALTANMNWNASSDQSWLTVSPLTGFGSNSLTFSAGENLSIEKRVAYVTITGQGIEPVIVKVTQEEAIPMLSVNDDGFIFSKEGGSISDIALFSNVNWNASTDQSWLTVSPLSGFGDNFLTFSAIENTSLDQRVGYVTFSSQGIESIKLKVTQEGGESFFTLSTDEIHLGYQQGSSATIDVITNSQWIIANMDPWLTADPVAGSGDAVITFTAQANPSQMDRPGNIMFKPNGKEALTVLAIQLAKPVSAKSIEMDEKYTIYPNPVNDDFQIKGIDGEAEITVTDLSGRVCLKQTIKNNESVQTGNLAKGVYIVTVTDSIGKVEMKLIKE